MTTTFQQRQEQRAATHYQDFCEFAKIWLIQSGSVHKNTVVSYFRDHFTDNRYKYSDQITDDEIGDCLKKWNDEIGQGEGNELGMYLGIGLNLKFEEKLKQAEARILQEEALKAKKIKIILHIAEAQKKGARPDSNVLREAAKLGLITLGRQIGDPTTTKEQQSAAKDAPPPALMPKPTKEKIKRKKSLNKANSKKQLVAEHGENEFNWDKYHGEMDWDQYKGDFQWTDYAKTLESEEKAKKKTSTKDDDHNTSKKDRDARSKSPSKTKNDSSKKDRDARSKSPTRNCSKDKDDKKDRHRSKSPTKSSCSSSDKKDRNRSKSPSKPKEGDDKKERSKRKSVSKKK